jgi:hypothetical protein
VKKTRIDWVNAVFGEPTSTAKLDDGSEIWKWAYMPLELQGPLFSVWQSGGKDEPKVRESVTFLQIKDGLVLDKWRD